MVILDILFIVLFLLAVAVAIVLVLTAGLSMPLADLVNRVLRRTGLAGPSRGSRSIGAQGVGRVDEEFQVVPSGEHAEGKLLVKGELWNARCDLSVASTLKRGEEVEFVYDEDLTVTVLQKAQPDADR
jgi:membrane protein implicated in regulation of membrane protease activity